MKSTSNSIRAALCIVFFSSSVLVSFSPKAEVYKWKDSQGITQYSDKPPPQTATKPGSQKLKELLDAEVLCSINPKPKNAGNVASNSDASQNSMANLLAPGLNNPLILKKNSAEISQSNDVSNKKLKGATASPLNSLQNTSKSTTPEVRSATAGMIFKNRDFTKQSFNVDGVHVIKLPKTGTTPTLPLPKPPPPPVPVPVPVPVPAPTPVPVPTPGTGFMPVPNMALVMTPFAGFSDIRVRPTTELPDSSPDDNGAFRISCEASHMLKDDPIVFPGQQGRAHLHTFFGNTGASYISTSESLRTTGNSTCNGGIMNRSGYWVPSMIDTSTGTPLKPRNILVYYKHGIVKQIPRGLKMIAGSMASSSAQNEEWFECNELYASRKPFLVSCGKGGLLSAAVSFPSCWDGKNLDSPDHKAHMAYPADEYVTTNTCPATHPIRIPTITIITYYPVTTDLGTSKWRLASDNYPTTSPAGYSSHADFMMGWDESFHKAYVDNCINKAKDCHAHLLGDGREFY